MDSHCRVCCALGELLGNRHLVLGSFSIAWGGGRTPPLRFLPLESSQVCAPSTGQWQMFLWPRQLCLEALSPRQHLQRTCPVQGWTPVPRPPLQM